MIELRNVSNSSQVIVMAKRQYKFKDYIYFWLAAFVLIALLIINQFVEQGENLVFDIIGGLVLLSSVVLFFPPFLLLSKHGEIKKGDDYMHTSRVVDKGVYALVRHPQYLGYAFIGVGFALISQHWLILFLALSAFILFYLHTIQEERFCLEKFGDAYGQYVQQVPRFNVFLGLYRLLVIKNENTTREEQK